MASDYYSPYEPFVPPEKYIFNPRKKHLPLRELTVFSGISWLG
jgi:hypothetical protein